MELNLKFVLWDLIVLPSKIYLKIVNEISIKAEI